MTAAKPRISQRAVDLIVSCEVSSRAYYEKNYRHPEWPGERSGVTIAIGYDLGYCTLAKLHLDWDGRLPPDMIRVMERCLGVTGDAARHILPLVKPAIDVPWDAAMAVFLERDVPQWTDAVVKAVPKAAALPADSLGALVSLAYNRGASFNNAGDRFLEMRAIKRHVDNDQPARVPLDLRAMKRLWPASHGLQARRDAEAKLFDDGLRAPAAQPAAHRVNETPAAALPAKPAGPPEHGSSAGSAAIAAKAAHDAVPPEHVWTLAKLAIAGLGVVCVAAVVWLAVRWWTMRQPVLARGKGMPAAA